jgi:predicted RNase H-like nuclease
VASYDTGEVRLIQKISEILTIDRAGSFLIDMAIGLPSREQPLRNCEEGARALLPRERKSSVFGVPCREALRARTYERANVLNRKILGKGLSLQSWYLGPKIREVDDFLAAHEGFHLRESHPEIAFQFLNGSQPLRHGKKSAEGRAERLGILQSWDSRTQGLSTQPLKHATAKASRDDILDALSLALTQKLRRRDRLSKTSARVVSAPLKDAGGLVMAIYYYQQNHR